MIVGLWVVSVLGRAYNFLTLVYIGNVIAYMYVSYDQCFFLLLSLLLALLFHDFFAAIVLLFTVPVFYEKYEDQVDPLAEKAMIEIKKQYAVFDAKVLSKIPRGPSKDKKI